MTSSDNHNLESLVV